MIMPECLFRNRYVSTIQNLVLKCLDCGTMNNVEIEARLGRIVSKITTKRIGFEVQHPIVFESLPNEYKFVSGVEKNDFSTIKHALFPDASPAAAQDRVTVSRSVRKIERDGSTRYEKKVKVLSIDVHLPDMLYDVRVSVSREFSVDQKEFGLGHQSSSYYIQRDRDRESFRCNEYSFDFTKILDARRETAEGAPRTYEVEVEVKDSGFKRTEFVTIALNLPVLKKK